MRIVRSLISCSLLLLITFLVSSCVRPQETDFSVRISYTPSTVYAGDEVTLEVSTIPQPLVQINTSVVLRIDGVDYMGSRVPFRKILRFSEGDHTIKAYYVYDSETFESSSIVLSVEPVSNKYSLALNVPDKVDYGSDANISISINPVPNISGWYVELYINDDKVLLIKGEDFSEGVYNYTLTNLDVGTYSLKAVFKSEYGSIESQAKTLKVVDTTPPSITDFRLIPSEPIENRPVYVFIEFVEDESSVEKVEAYLDGEEVSSSRPLGNFVFLKISDSLRYGEYNLDVFVTNTSGISSEIRRDFNVIPLDEIPPNVEVSTRKGIYSTGESVYMNLNIEDDTGIERYEIEIDGETVASVVLDQPRERISYSRYLGKFSEGLHVIMVSSYDLAGNMGQGETYFYTTDSIVNVKIFMMPENPDVGDMTTFYVSIPPDASVSNLDILVDSSPIYSYPSSDTEFRTYALWKAQPGYHRATVFVKTYDDRYGMDNLNFRVRDISPPEVAEVRVNGSVLGTDPYSPVVVDPGEHTIRVTVVDDSALPRDNTIEMDVYDRDGEEVLLQTLVLGQVDLSSDRKRAVYEVRVNMPIGSYALLPKNIPDEVGNVLESADRYYLDVRY